MKKNSLFLILIIFLSGCSTYSMNNYLAEENYIETEKYDFDDEAFEYDEEKVQAYRDRFNEDELSESNIDALMEDEISSGNYNEVIVYLRYLQEEDPDRYSTYSTRYVEGLETHISDQNTASQELVDEAITFLENRYESDPENTDNAVTFAQVLINSGEDVNRGTLLLEEVESDLIENEEEPGQQLLYALAQGYYESGDYEESLDRYQSLLVIDSDNPDYYYEISLVHSALGNSEEEEQAVANAYESTTDFLNRYGDSQYDIITEYLNNL